MVDVRGAKAGSYCKGLVSEVAGVGSIVFRESPHDKNETMKSVLYREL